MSLQKSNLMKQILLLRNWINCLVNRTLSTYSAMSRYPQEAAAWRGIQPSLSGWLMLAPCSTRKVTMSTLSSMHACERWESKGVSGHCKKQEWPALCVYVSSCVRVHVHVHVYMSLSQWHGLCYTYNLLAWKEHCVRLIATCFQNCWEILAAGAFPKCLHIAGVLEIPHSVVLLMEALTCCAYTLLFMQTVRGFTLKTLWKTAFA